MWGTGSVIPQLSVHLSSPKRLLGPKGEPVIYYASPYLSK